MNEAIINYRRPGGANGGLRARVRLPRAGGAPLPVSVALALPRGRAKDTPAVSLAPADDGGAVDGSGAVAAQGDVLARWPDESVRWLLVTAVLPPGDGPRERDSRAREGLAREGLAREGRGGEGRGDEGRGDEGQGDEGQGDEGQGDQWQITVHADDEVCLPECLLAQCEHGAMRVGLGDRECRFDPADGSWQATAGGLQTEGGPPTASDSESKGDSASKGGPAITEGPASAGGTQTEKGTQTGGTQTEKGTQTERPYVSVSPVRLTDARGRTWQATNATAWRPTALGESVRLLANGPVCTTVEWQGSFPHVRGLRVAARWTWFAWQDLVLAEITLHNPRRARHAGGLWDLGDPGSVTFRDLSFDVEIPSGQGATLRAHTLRARVEPGAAWTAAGAGPVEIYQASSGGENWNSENHVNRHGAVPLEFRGYRGQAGEARLAGLRATPVVELATDRAAVVAAMPDFWQEFPKAIEAGEGKITVRLFPQQFGDGFELQGGEQKTHRVALFARPRSGASQPAGEREMGGGPHAGGGRETGDGREAGGGHPRWPAVVACDGVANEINAQEPGPLLPGLPGLPLPGLPSVTAGDAAVLARLDGLLHEFVHGPGGVLAQRERVDEYGWRNYGDLHADHEEQYYTGPRPLISHYNNQFDVLCGYMLQWRRTGDEQWLDLAAPLARHVADVDIYRTSRDRPAYNGGLFWFTDHYLHARTGTHRTYSRHNRPAGGGPYGGGPGQEHNFTTGLLLHHLQTGDAQAERAVRLLADWVLAMDDGRLTRLGAVDGGPTGRASTTGDPLYQGPGRGAGNSINALLDGWLLTADRRYLEYAETLVRRCIHPSDDIEGLDLPNAEKRWSYTVFLTSLAKYLECKVEAGEVDERYAYGQASLLHYGRWMLEHERPYFDRREELEFPTEAWAAQEFRKANALRLAALHAKGPLRTQMFDRGDELAERAWSDLMSFSTRTAVRAMAVVMVEGLRDAELRLRPARRFPECRAKRKWGARTPFVPQRERVKRRLKSPAAWPGLALALANPLRWPRLMNPW